MDIVLTNICTSAPRAEVECQAKFFAPGDWEFKWEDAAAGTAAEHGGRCVVRSVDVEAGSAAATKWKAGLWVRSGLVDVEV